MEENLKFDEKTSLPASGNGLTRRAWVQRMIAGAGAGIAAPVLAGARIAANPDVQDVIPPSAAEAWKPAFFDDAQLHTLSAVAERIVPGSAGVQADHFLDKAFSACPQETQQKFVAALNAIEGESLRQFTKSFEALSSEQQDQVLAAASSGKSTNPTLSAASASNPTPPPSLRDYFEHVKGWVSTAYYSSETGMKELGWNGENFFESLPGCEDAAGHS